MEATGSYWIALATTLYHADYAVSVINPALEPLKRQHASVVPSTNCAITFVHAIPWAKRPLSWNNGSYFSTVLLLY
jgi:hypothetical protein